MCQYAFYWQINYFFDINNKMMFANDVAKGKARHHYLVHDVNFFDR